MLTQMRALSQNWIGRLILGLVLSFIILSFAVWGIGDRFNNVGGNFIAKVGDARISVNDYRTDFQNTMTRIEQQQKRSVSVDEARRAGVDRQVLSRLLSMTILDQEAKKLGLAVSDDTVRQKILTNPIFKGKDGQFNRRQFDALLGNMSERAYIADERSDMMRTDVSDAIVGGLAVPKAMVSAVHAYRSEVRDLEFLVLPPAAAGTIPAPTDAELKTYYDERKDAFTAPEYRKLVVLSIIPANLFKPDAVTDAEIAQRYDEMKAARFEVPERRTLEQMLYPDEAAANAAGARLKGGAGFDALAADASSGGKDFKLGSIPKTALGDPAVADAAFALPADGTTQPIKTQFGWAILHASKIVPGRTQSLADVSGELRNEIAVVRAKKQAEAARQTVEDARKAGKTVAEAAAAAGLKPRVIEAVTSQGRGKDGHPVEGLPDGPELLKAAFNTGVGDDTDTLTTADGGDVWYEVAGIEAAHDLPLADVKAKVEALWRNDEIARRLAVQGDRLVKEIDGGKSLAAVAAENGKLQLVKAENIAREGTPVLPAPALAEIFAVKVGKAGSAAEPNHGRLVFKVDAARVPPLPEKDPDAEKLKAGFVNDVIAQYLAKLQGEIGVSLNQQALTTALGGDSGS